jgi:DNA repair protein SbcD/Mre11
MRNFKFLHAADLHFDSPLRGLARYEGVPANEIRLATRKATERLVDLAIAEKVDFVILAGDLYDGDWEDYRTGLALQRALGRITRAGIPIYIISGNHDARSKITRSLPPLDGAHTFGIRNAESITVPGLDVVIHGQSYAKPDLRENIASRYPPAQTGSYNIGVLHTALNGRDGHEPYAPCTVEQLAAHGYDYWALGHVHNFEVVREAPYIVYPGNVQGRNIREVGARGVVLVTVTDQQTTPLHVPVDVLRWERIVIDVSGAQGASEAQDCIRVGLRKAVFEIDRPVIARVLITGAKTDVGLPRDPTGLRAACMALADEVSADLWIEKVEMRMREAVATAPGERAEDLQCHAEAVVASGEAAKALQEELAQFLEKLPPELQDDPLIQDIRAGRVDHVLKDAIQLLSPTAEQAP